LTSPARDSHCDAAGFVLAGGQSSRMGEDKALITFAGRPLIVRALGILRQAGFEPSIAGARSALASFAPVVEDSAPQAGLGPLAGICSALAATTTPHAAFITVDLPLLPSSLIVYLLHHATVTGAVVTVPAISGFAQTFPAVIHRSALPILQSQLESSNRGCFSAFQVAAATLNQPFSVLPVEPLVQSGQISHPDGLPAAFWFLNVNGRQDLTRAEALVSLSLPVS
jgi:molybdopterin-guanine dinucleotide biosynthesis protein A